MTAADGESPRRLVTPSPPTEQAGPDQHMPKEATALAGEEGDGPEQAARLDPAEKTGGSSYSSGSSSGSGGGIGGSSSSGGIK